MGSPRLTGIAMKVAYPQTIKTTHQIRADQILRSHRNSLGRAGHLTQIIDNRAVDELCTSREVRLRSQESDYPRPVDRTARRALTVYGGALRSSRWPLRYVFRGESLGVWWWVAEHLW
jgi:hypothetical protein